MSGCEWKRLIGLVIKALGQETDAEKPPEREKEREKKIRHKGKEIDN